jgi:protein-tyrosine-phosphatase
MNVLFVCHANTSRSIMAEILLRAMLEERGLGGTIRVHSAGIAPYARDGALVSLDTRFALRDHGIHLGEHKRSTDLKRNLHLLEAADLVLAMTAEQKAIVDAMPQAAGKSVFTLREFAGDPAGSDIADPASRDEAFFRDTCAVIKRSLEESLPRLLDLAERGA